MNKNIIHQLRKYIDLSESEATVFNSYVETRQLKKKEFILEESQVCRHLLCGERVFADVLH
jgi:hypothetical protein